MTTDAPQDPKYRTRESMGRLYDQLAEMERQRDTLRAACDSALVFLRHDNDVCAAWVIREALAETEGT